VSTIGTVSHVASEPVAESPNHVLSPKLGGYSASKLICELIIEEHVKSTAGQRAAICRVGQIAGPVRRSPESGAWNRQEWLPSVIASSKHMGLLPSSLGSMDLVNWVPVDLLSEIILELSGVVQAEQPELKQSSSVGIYHAVNPHAVRWAELVPTVAGVIGLKPGDAVPWNQWVDALKLSGQESADPEKNPGLKLVDFYESLGGRKQKGGEMAMMPVVATEVSAAKSKTLAALHPVGTDWMALWVRQLGF
jgi:thioester reductase-like protein